MTEKNPQQPSQLIGVLREGIGVVQMVIFKELRTLFADKYPHRDISNRAMLVGAIINKLFGLENPEEKFQIFNRENQAVIEQELLAMVTQLPKLRGYITDALRVQVLCDTQEGLEPGTVLKQAEELGLLIKDRDIPLPSTFMSVVRQLGEENGLTIAPLEISEDDDVLMH